MERSWLKMEQSFKDLTISQYIDVLKSEQPTVGGGNTSALLCALSFSLAHMVATLSINKASQENLEELIKTKEVASKSIPIALSFMDKDTQAFALVMAAFKYPKNSDDEKQYRSEAIQSATIGASKVPLEVAQLACKAFDTCYSCMQIGLKSAQSDAFSGCVSAIASCEAALANVEINANSIKDLKVKEQLLADLHHIQQTLNNKKALINR